MVLGGSVRKILTRAFCGGMINRREAMEKPALRLKRLREALSASTPSLRQVAREAGVSEDAVYLYRMGKRRPSERSARALLAALERHHRRAGKALDRLRNEL